MKKPRIILDTNVLFAGLYSSLGASYQVLRAVEEKKIKIVLSTTLLFEYEEVLKRKQSELEISDQHIEIILDNLCDLSDFQVIYFLWRPYLKGPKDDHILELAVASDTKIIVTHNVKDFKNVGKFGIQAVPPGKFLEVLK